MNYLLFK